MPISGGPRYHKPQDRLLHLGSPVKVQGTDTNNVIDLHAQHIMRASGQLVLSYSTENELWGQGGEEKDICAIAFTFLNKPLCRKALMTFYLEQRALTEGRAHSHSLPSTLLSHTVFLMGPLSSPTLVPPWNAVAKLSGRGRPRCAARRWCWFVLCHHGYSGTLFSASVDYHLADLWLLQEQRK